ncbi:acyltransferase [Permianibacter aggregans]|uniref:Peptidoglycan/LPS O-acetylase OafA/YrhL n=1 Tax=Permianibacter aggregans TaxID=1510150 RepID=A0A4R6UIW0_9GAMM|nr:acyltransferase [Permianibacter aggregans]TDQ46026.1 peptidoglycan/LPS O-acetylase OafA/YrhL [Permianibacter aggregans]
MQSPNTRYYFLDWLRMLAILGVVLYHVGMFFVPWGWHIKNPELVGWLETPMDIAHRLRMPLLFVIAGAVVAYSLNRRTVAALLQERSRRLLIPIVFGMFVIVPPQIYVERMVNGEFSADYLSYFFERVLQFQPYPVGDFAWHHLWFIVYLFVYMLLFTPLFAWWKKQPKRLQPGWWLLVLALPLGINEALLRPYFPERHSLLNDWWTFNNYALLLLYGFFLSRLPGVWEWLQQRRRLLLALVGATVAVILPLKAIQIVQAGNVWDGLSANVFVWFSILAMLGYAKQWLNRPSQWLMDIREAAYPTYILHQTVIILLAWPLIDAPLSIAVKAAILIFGTMLCCLAVYALLIRPFAVMRVLFGLPAQRQMAQGEKNEKNAVVYRADVVAGVNTAGRNPVV